MRISHSKSGICAQFTEAEHRLLGDRVELTLQPKEKEAFLILRPMLVGGRALCKGQGHRRMYPWRVQWENLPEVKAIPYFGSEDVELTPKGDTFVVPRPSMRRPPTEVGKKKMSSAKPGGSAETLGGLEELVDGINECKRRLGGNLVLEVTQDGYLRTLVQFGRR